MYMYGELPLELLILILQNLPTKSLLRFRCVSKSWYSLISSPSFISLHHQHSVRTHETNGDNLFLVRHHSLTHGKKRNTLFLDCHDSFIEQFDLNFPWKTRVPYHYVGSCDGLVCFSNSTDDDLKIVVWNPSMRKCLEVPVPRFVATDFMLFNVVGLGLDCKTNAYKVVYNIRNTKALSQVEIYDVTTNVWRTIQMDVPFLAIKQRGVYANGAIHWLGCKAIVDGTPFPRLLLVLFDLQDEEFKEITMPDAVAHAHAPMLIYDLDLTLATFEETICLIHYQPVPKNREESRHCCIWVMTKYGHEDSWVKLFTIDMKAHGYSMRVLGFRKNGQVLLVDSCAELVSYEIGSQKVTRLGLYGVEGSFEILPYLDSLVLLTGKGQLQ